MSFEFLRRTEESSSTANTSENVAENTSSSAATETEDNQNIEERVAEIRRNYQRMIYNARSIGANVAADNLQAFIDGNVSERILSAEWLRSFWAVESAEDRIKGYFEERSIPRFIENLGDGTHSVESDYWRADIQEYNPLSELAYASGASKTQGNGNFNLRRNGNTIDIEGTVTINWWDAYDWESGASFWIPGSGTISDEDGIFLKQHGGAKEFMMRSAWSFTYSGTYDIEDEELSNSTWSYNGPTSPDRSLGELPRPNEGGAPEGSYDGTDDEVDTDRRRRNNREDYRRDRDMRRDREETRR